jgi:hypothetical protein
VDICTNQNENIDEIYTKQPKMYWKIHTSQWILKSQEKPNQTKSLKCLCIPKRKLGL